MMQVWHLQTQLINIQLRNRLRVRVGFYSGPAQPTEVKSVLSFGAQITRTGTYARTHTGKRGHIYSLLPWHSNKYKSSCTVIAHTKEPSLRLHYLSYEDS